MRDTPATMRRLPAVLIASGALGLSGCGSAGSAAASRPAPPTPVVVSAYVAASQLRISPVDLGAGPILLTVTNQSPHTVVVSITPAGSGAVIRSGPIQPQGVTQVKAILSRGRYRIGAVPAGSRTDAEQTLPQRILAATLRVGRERPSGGGNLLSP